jgi:hypothetical protein
MNKTRPAKSLAGQAFACKKLRVYYRTTHNKGQENPRTQYRFSNIDMHYQFYTEY